MKFSLPSLAVVLLEVSLSSSFRGGGGGGGGVNAVCVPGDPNSIVSFCDGVLNLDDTGPGPGPDFEPDGITLFCIELSVSGIIDDILDNGDEDFTIFAPTNEAFNNLFFELFFDISPFEKKSLLLYHIIQGSIVPPVDALCTSKLPVSFGGKNGEGSLPKIRCFDDIVGRKTSSVVGPLNKAKLDNIPQLSRGGEVVSEEYCNGIVYKVSNVILPKFVEDIFDITCGTIQKENSVVNFFTKNEEFTIVAGGVYNLLASPPKLLVGRASYSASKRCTGDAEYFCYEKCKNEIPDCTAVEVVDFFEEEFFGDGDAEYLCQFYNGQVKNAPIFKDDLSSVRRGKLTNIYFQSDVLGPQLFVPSNITNFDPEFLKFPVIDGTQDFLDFVGPAFLCVAISGKDPILCDQCIKDNTNPLRQSCTDLVNFFCTDSGLADPINGKCQEECFSGNTCLAKVQTASLATIGQTVFDSPEGNFDEGGCLTRDVFDPQIDAVVAPYTCPEQATS